MGTTQNKNLSIPTPGTESGSWGNDLNSNTFIPIDNMLGGVASVSLSSTNYTLGTNSATELQCLVVKLTSNIVANIIVSSPVVGFYCVENNTTGNFTITWQANFGSGPVGAGFVIPQGTRTWVVSDTSAGARLCPAWIASLLTNTLTAGALSVMGASTFGGSIAFNGTSYAFGSGAASNDFKAALSQSQSLTATGSTLAIDMSLGRNAELTLSANVTSVSVSNWPPSGTLGRLTLDITSAGSFTMSGWPGTTRWAAGTAPTITTSGRDTIVLVSADGGSNFRGFVAAQAMA